MKEKIIDKLKACVEFTPEEINFLSEKLNEEQKYGLIWEDHPEGVELELKNGVFKIEELKDKKISMNPKGRENLLLEGDNLHSLMALKEAGVKVDVIYIDPPYNTLNEKGFRYNDKMIDKNDSYRHSKWLSFMHKRLELARDLLADDGVIFVSIDDNELYNLKLLMDQVFREDNFIGNITWYKGFGKNSSNFLSNNTEYLLVYTKNFKTLNTPDKYFSIEKKGVKDVENIVMKYREKGSNFVQEKIREYYKKNDNLKGVKNYNKVEDSTFRIYRGVTLEKPYDPCYYYDVIHPITKKACKTPSKGWNRPKESMSKLLKNNEILFGKDHTTLPNRKYYLDEMKYEVPKTLVENFQQGGTEIKDIMGSSVFSFPKPSSLIIYILKITNNKNATVLDFFAGSGTTGQAVMELNEEDGGTRRFILCTNNENNICEEVTYERNRRVITGEYAKEKVEPLPNNLSYYKVDIENIEDLSAREKKKNNDNKKIAHEFWKTEQNI